MALSENQKTIVQFAQQNQNRITKKQAVDLIGGHYYCNSDHHVGEVLSRMVKSGILFRYEKGKYEISRAQGRRGTREDIKNHPTLF